ncbi:MAG: hypothetical protein RLZZ519_2963 [Bacteroidota bacterium]|jgi:uncharacterized Ntn-hydrolase superfamily protein
MKRLLILGWLLALCRLDLAAQDTFSIVAVDSITGEVGSAGASCVDLFSFPGYTNDFLGDLIPGVGAVNTQAYYLAGNQTNARARMNAGDTPQQIIDWLVANDIQGNPNIRQYGVVGLVNGSPQAAAHTGVNTDNYKGHVLGPNYSIQGNILLGQMVLDSMEAQFNRAPGDLACKLMAALQGANMVGADTRCSVNGTSSLFAFVKVSQPNDPYGSPSFLVSVKTHNNAGIEPIDTLQTLFDQVKSCNATAIQPSAEVASLRVFPNPVHDRLTVEWEGAGSNPFEVQILDAMGRVVLRMECFPQQTISIGQLARGLYRLQVVDGENKQGITLIKN